MKQGVILAGVLALALLVSGCQGQNAETGGTPKPSLEAQAAAWEEQSLAYVDSFRSGDFGGFYQTVGRELAGGSAQEVFSAAWNAAAAKARTYRDAETAVFREADGRGEVTVVSTHARYELVTTFTYGADGLAEAVACATQPLPVPPEESETWWEEPVTLGYDPEKQLNGLLTLPRGVERPPVAVLVQGSGPNGMDSLIGASDNRPFADLAHGLAEQGIAVLRYDKRSYAYPEDVTDIQTEYLYDVREAVRLLQADGRVDGQRLYLIGHSQGGMMGPLLLTENPEFKGFVSMAGTLRRLEDIVMEQSETMMAQDTGLTQAEKEAVLSGTRADVARIKSLTAQRAASADVLIQGYPERYWQSINAMDARALAEDLEVPMLILQGKNDFQVLYESDYALWQEALAGRDDVTFQAYDGLSHVFMPGSRERFEGAVYDPPAHVEPRVIADIAAWIHSL